MRHRSRPFLTFVLVPVIVVLMILVSALMGLWGKAKTILTIVLFFLASGCSSLHTFTLPHKGCVAHKDRTTLAVSYENVIVVSEKSETEWNVTYPDSNSKTEYNLDKSVVRFWGCPSWNNSTNFGAEYR